MRRCGRCHFQGTRDHFGQSREGRAPGDVSQQLGRRFISSHHEGFLTHQGENEQIVGPSFNISISQGEFKYQPLSVLGPSHSLPPPLQVWSLLDSQNTTFVAITCVATGLTGEVDSEPIFSPEEMQHEDLVSPHSGTCGMWEHKRGPWDTISGKSMASPGPGPFSAGGEPLPALCRL